MVRLAWFRRSLATNLYDLGVAESTVQAILGRTDVDTTSGRYIKTVVVPEASREAMRKLESVFTKMQKANRSSRNLNTAVRARMPEMNRGLRDVRTDVGTTKHRKSLESA